MIIIFLILLGLAIGGYILQEKSYAYDWSGTIICFTSTIILVLALGWLPIVYYSYDAEISKYQALKDTIEYSRQDNISEYERATILRDIADYNKNLAGIKYWNDTIFDIYIPDELAELEYLR